MKRFFMVSLLLVSPAMCLWFFYPTSIPATLYVSDNMSGSEFVSVKRDFINSTAGIRGIVARGDTQPGGVVAIYCRDVPLVLVANGPGGASMSVFFEAVERAPEVVDVVRRQVSRMEKLGDLRVNVASEDGDNINRFFLKYRDGIDLDAECKGAEL